MVECEGYNTTPTCPIFSSYDSLTGNCKCDAGYAIGSDGACTSGNVVCSEKYGYGSEYDYLSSSCKCQFGYSLDASGQCVEL